MAIHLPIGSLKTTLGWSRYRDANPVPTSPLSDDITTAPSGRLIESMDSTLIYHIVTL